MDMKLPNPNKRRSRRTEPARTMTVGEMVDALKKYDRSLPVVAGGVGSGWLVSVRRVRGNARVGYCDKHRVEEPLAIEIERAI